MAENKKRVSIASSYRWIENGHILLWLIKDSCWALEFKPGGLFMVFPTVAVAFYILYRSRHNRQEFIHNIAVCLWIIANSLWMTGEFFKLEFRPIACGIFITGVFMLVIYYVFYFNTDRRSELQTDDLIGD